MNPCYLRAPTKRRRPYIDPAQKLARVMLWAMIYLVFLVLCAVAGHIAGCFQ